MNIQCYISSQETEAQRRQWFAQGPWQVSNWYVSSDLFTAVYPNTQHRAKHEAGC